MKIAKQQTGSTSISAYRRGAVSIGGIEYTDSLMIIGSDVITPWQHRPAPELSTNCLHAAIEAKPELIVVGCGESQVFPPAVLMGFMASNTIGLEVMTTHAACRTFNVLQAEGRDVVAALILD